MPTSTLKHSTIALRPVGTSKTRREIAVLGSAVSTSQALVPRGQRFTAEEVFREMQRQMALPEHSGIERWERVSVRSVDKVLAQYSWEHPRELVRMGGNRYVWQPEE